MLSNRCRAYLQQNCVVNALNPNGMVYTHILYGIYILNTLHFLIFSEVSENFLCQDGGSQTHLTTSRTPAVFNTVVM